MDDACHAGVCAGGRQEASQPDSSTPESSCLLGIEERASERRRPSAEPKARRGIRNQASRPFTPSPAASGAPVDGGHGSRSGDLPPVSACFRAKNRDEPCGRRVGMDPERNVFPMGWDTTCDEYSAVRRKNNRGDCSPVPHGNRVGRTGTGKQRTMSRLDYNLSASRSGSSHQARIRRILDSDKPNPIVGFSEDHFGARRRRPRLAACRA